MTIYEIKQKKQLAEAQIFEILADLQSETGMIVDELNFSNTEITQMFSPNRSFALADFSINLALK